VSITNFQPEIWSAEILVNLREKLVYGQAGVINRDYEGDIAQAGDTVHITSFGRPTISDYSKYGTLTYEQLTDATRALLIDQAKSFSFGVDDIDRRQALGGFVENAMSDAAFGLAESADIYLAGVMKTAVDGTANDLGSVTATVSTSTGYGAVLVALNVALDRAKVPQDGRWVIFPPEVYGAFLQDNRFINAAASGDQSNQALRNGALDTITGFTVYKSNNVPTDTTGVYDVIAGHPIATTLADQILETEALRLIDYIGDGLRGLHVFGAKVVRPDCLAMASVTVA
jgi:hypothetical protein